MRAVPHWQTWLEDYGKLTLLNMSVHHLDCFRFLLGNPESVYASARTDPRTRFAHRDGMKSPAATTWIRWLWWMRVTCRSTSTGPFGLTKSGQARNPTSPYR